MTTDACSEGDAKNKDPRFHKQEEWVRIESVTRRDAERVRRPI